MQLGAEVQAAQTGPVHEACFEQFYKHKPLRTMVTTHMHRIWDALTGWKDTQEKLKSPSDPPVH